MASLEFTAASPVPFIDSFTHPSSHLFSQQILGACCVAAS